MVIAPLKKYSIFLLFFLFFAISKSSDVHINSKLISKAKKNINNNIVINKKENESNKYKILAESTNDSWFIRLFNNYPEICILCIIGIIIIIILVIIIIICLLKSKNKYQDLNEQINKVSFQTEDKLGRESLEDDELIQ